MVAPREASVAVWDSWGVRSWRVSELRLRAVSPVATSLSQVRSAKPRAYLFELRVRGTQLLPGLGAALAPPEPSAVQEPGAGQLEGARAVGQAVDGRGVERVGFGVGSEQGARAGEQAERQR